MEYNMHMFQLKLAMLLTAGVYDPYANVTMPWQNWMNTGFKGASTWLNTMLRIADHGLADIN